MTNRTEERKREPIGRVNERQVESITIDEREAELSEIWRARSEVKRRRAVLESEIRAAGESLYDVAGALKKVCEGTMGIRADHILRKFASLPHVCDLRRLEKMLEELKQLQMKLNQLNESAAQIGTD